ncbi:TetR/AcrR family transcriptional regulator [Brachybacterium sp. AOP43-C2-M15]|uniref:TetR/AcrR family transcriptional regulator n=1 Tax=Brachybacterium sp. AOP43-C2-M15 TaxID=3457661 RepID=UPI0040333A3F
MRADAMANREAILDAAKELFEEQGVEVAFRVIAARAGVGVATMHRHFPDREVLLRALADHLDTAGRAVLREHEELWESDPWAAWHGVVHGLADIMIAPLVSSASEFARAAEREEAFVRFAQDRDLEPLQRVLDRAISHGYAPATLDPRRFIVGIAVVSRPLPEFTADPAPVSRTWIVDVFIDGLRAGRR